MEISEKLCMKFPAVLRDKLLTREIELPDETLFEYEKFLVYRAVEREADDHHGVTAADFKSYFELGKNPKKMRGVSSDYRLDPHYYGVSTSLQKEIVEQQMRFPNPHKKMAVGYVHQEGGPQHTKAPHVCWWLYEGADVSGFKLMEG